MGNEQCPDCKEPLTENPAYGSHQIITQSHSFYALIQKKIENTPNIHSLLIQQLEKRTKIANPHVVFLVKLCQYAIVEQPYGFKVSFIYQYVGKCLRNRVQEAGDLDWTQRQLFSIVYGVQNGLEQLKKQKIKHCCINLQTILFKNSIYKITDVSTTTYLTSYDMARLGSRQQFLSENLLVKLYHQAIYPIYTYEDDLFSLGMIVLMLGTHSKNSDFYQWNQQGHAKLNKKNIVKCVKIFRRKYCCKLSEKVLQLVGQGCSDVVEGCDSGGSVIKMRDFEEDTTVKGFFKNASRISTGMTPDKSLSLLRM